MVRIDLGIEHELRGGKSEFLRHYKHTPQSIRSRFFAGLIQRQRENGFGMFGLLEVYATNLGF
jgi:hypothetical protein